MGSEPFFDTHLWVLGSNLSLRVEIEVWLRAVPSKARGSMDKSKDWSETVVV